MSLCYKLDAVCIENTIYLFIDQVLVYRFYISIVCYFCMIFFVFLFYWCRAHDTFVQLNDIYTKCFNVSDYIVKCMIYMYNKCKI